LSFILECYLDCDTSVVVHIEEHEDGELPFNVVGIIRCDGDLNGIKGQKGRSP
jgi:hypothetical protein